MRGLIRRSTVLATGAVGFALLSVPNAIGQVQTYKQAYPLASSHAYSLHGTKSADGSCAFPGAVPGASSASAPAPLVLAPGQKAVEVRQTSLDESTCTTTMQQGTPPASALQSPSANAMQEKSGPAAGATASGLSATAARAAAANRYSKGYVTTFFEDPVNIDVTKVNDGIAFNYNGTCVTYGSQAYDYYGYTTSGWGLNGDNFRTSTTCDLEAASSYALFANGAFCFPNRCYNHYNRTSIHGHRDGYLYGFWNSNCDGDARCGLLTFHAQLIRQAG